MKNDSELLNSKNPTVLMMRVSSVKQEKTGYSLASQDEMGMKYCKDNDLDVIEKIELVETASKYGQRHKFDELVKRIIKYQETSGKIIHLVVEKSDRLSRNHTDKERIQRLVLTGRLILHYFREKKVLYQDCSPEEIFIDDINTSRDKYTSLNLAKETSKGSLKKAKEGWFPGWAPFGFMNIRDGKTNKHGRLEARVDIDPIKKPIAMEVYRLLYKCAGDDYTIAKKLVTDGVVPKGMKFNRKHIELLRSERYLLFHLGKFKWRGQIFDGKHPTYIPEEWLLTIMERKGKKINTKHGLGTYSHMFRCAFCDSSIVWVPKKKKLKSGETKIYNLYWCGDSKKAHRENKEKIFAINENKINDAFEKVLENISIPEKMAKEIASLLKVRFDNFSSNQASKVNTLKGKLSELTKKEDRLYDDYCDQIVSGDVYKRQCDRIKNDREKIQSEINFYGCEVDAKELYTNSLEVLELGKSSKLLWKSMKPHERRTLMKTVCLNQRIDASSVEFYLKKAFLILSNFNNLTGTKKWCR